MAVLNPVFQPVLSRSKPVKIGTIVAAGNQFRFAMPSGDSYSYRGQLIIQVIPVGGTVTTDTINVRASLDGGTTFNNVPSGGAIDVNANPITRVDMSGLGAMQCEIQSNTFV